jgi:transglutaminase-like putative cysteine protease
MLYEVIHTTRYKYEAPVSQCLNDVRLTPRVLPTQAVKGAVLKVEPAPAFVYERKDYFGNDVSTFGVFETHEKLTATATSLVDVTTSRPAHPAESTPPQDWEAVRSQIAEQADEACLAASEFVYESPFVPLSPELVAYAKEGFDAKRPLLDVVQELSHRIHENFKYEPQSTSIDLPLVEVLRNRRGVCQDFAHVMIGALRSQRLAARYVSGYVRSGRDVVGAQASHAWVSVFFPEAGWIDFDPTNDVMPSDSHVTLAWGRDYGDVTPVKGITLGGRGQTVGVEVYVKPV